MRVLCCALVGLLLLTASGCDEAPATSDESVAERNRRVGAGACLSRHVWCTTLEGHPPLLLSFFSVAPMRHT